MTADSAKTLLEGPQNGVRFTVGLGPELSAWVESEAERRGISRRQLFKLAISRFRDAGEIPPPGTGPKPVRRGKKGLQQAFLAAVAEDFAVSRACRRSGVPVDLVRDWMKAEEFADRFADAQEAWVEALEADLAAIGRGERKGTAGALIAILEAHHPSYGRLRVENVSRLLGQVVDDFYGTIIEMAGETLGGSIVKRLRDIADKKLVGFGD